MNKTYKKLYSVDSKGKVRVWWQEQIDNKYRTCSGINDGKIVESEWTIAESKNVGRANATTATEQATAEILAKYEKQLKTGYHEDIEKADDGCDYVEPMLAKHYKDYADKINFKKSNWGIQIKFNGNRCVATKKGLFTRKGEKYISVQHINRELKSFFDKYPNAVLDGELYNYELRQKLNELSKLVRKTVHITDSDLKRSEEIVKFYVYDGYGFDNLSKNTAYSDRKKWIDENVVGKIKYIEKVVTYKIDSVETLNKKFQEFISDDEEGGILRDLDSCYENKRSKSLLKLKSEDDDEAIIVDVFEGDGNWSGVAKTATLKWKDKKFDATFKGSYEELKELDMLNNKKKFVGKEVTFLYNGLTGLGVPNYARIDVNNCFKTDK